MPYVDMSGDITNATTASGSSSVTRQWAMTLPAGISFDETVEKELLQAADAKAALPTFSYDEETRVLDITVDVTVTELDLKLHADAAGSYELSVADKNIMLTDSNKLEVVVSEAEEVESAITDAVEPVAATTDEVGTQASEALHDFDYGVTYKPDADATWGTEAAAQEVVTVYTFAELNNVVRYGTADYIKLGNDIVSDTFLAGGALARRDANANRRDYVIDGQGHTLDSGSVSWSYPESTRERNFYIKNIKMHSTNPYGCFMGAEANGNFTSMVFEDVDYDGSQLTASWTTTLFFRGENKVTSRYDSYTASYVNANNTGQDYSSVRAVYTGLTYRSRGQSGLEAYRVIFDEGTTFECTVENGDGLLIGSFRGKEPTAAGRTTPYVAVRTGANVNMVSQGNSGETWYYYTSDGLYYAGINIQAGGQLYVGTDSTLTMDVRNTTRTGIFLGGGTSSKRTNLTIDNGGTLNLLADGNRNTTDSKYAGIKLYQYSDLNILAGGKLTGLIENDWSGRPAVELAAYSTVTVGSAGAKYVNDDTPQGLLDITVSGTNGTALNLMANSSFTVKEFGQASFLGRWQFGTTSDFIRVDGSLLVGERGIFEATLSEEAGSEATGVRNLVNAPSTSSTFKFTDAYRVDLDARGNPNAALLSMGTSARDGTFTADIQGVYQWSDGNYAAGDNTYDKDWLPIYNAVVTYREKNIRTRNASSSEQVIADSFMSEYDTLNSERVLYSWIPDVTINIAEVSDNEERDDGKKITGVTNPNAYVTVSARGQVLGSLIETNPKLSGTDGGIISYNTLADANGNFEIAIPSDVTLYVGDEISIYSWRAGKYLTSTTDVLDKTAPEATTMTYYTYLGDTAPLASDFIDTITDKGVADTTGYPVEYNSATDIDTLMATEGTKSVYIDVSDLAQGFVYDVDGNQEFNADGTPKYQDASNTTDPPIEVELVVYADSTGIRANSPITLSFPDFKGMTDEQLGDYLLAYTDSTDPMKSTTPYAYSIADGVLTEWTDPDDFTVTDLGGLSGTVTPQPDTDYTVTITLPTSTSQLASDLTTTTIVNVINLNAKLTIKFVNDGGATLKTYSVGPSGTADVYDIYADVPIGENLDLTAEDPFKPIIDQKESYLTSGYASVTLTTPAGGDEAAIPILADGQEIVYTAAGQLTITSRPTTINFGTLTFNGLTQRVEDPTTNNDLIIADTRSDVTKGWVLKLALTGRMYSQSTNSYMNDAIRYKTAVDTDDVILTDQAVEVYSEATGGTGLFNVTDTWGTDEGSIGLKLVADPKDTTNSDIGDYTGEITWTIESAP
ncbi:pectate lyase-like adhesive domain-containing protein [Enterococcus sp. LJL120]